MLYIQLLYFFLNQGTCKIDNARKIIREEIRAHRQKLSDLVNQNNPQYRKFKDTNIPIHHNQPSLLLDDIGNVSEDEFRKALPLLTNAINNDAPVTVLIGPSGCGKTNTLFRYMRDHFTLFFVMSTAYSGGSDDLISGVRRAINSFANRNPFQQSLDVFSVLLKLVSIRLLLLDELMRQFDLFKPIHWFYLQESPENFFDKDIFVHLNSAIMFVSIKEIYEFAKEKLETLRLPFVVDEIQVLLGKQYLDKCVSCATLTEYNTFSDLCKGTEPQVQSIEESQFRSPLTILVYSIASFFKQRLVLSGTGINVQEVKNVVASMMGKNINTQPVYIYDFGDFYDLARFEHTITQYLPNEFDNDEIEELHERLRGRCRLTTGFITHYLVNRQKELAIKYLKDEVVDLIQANQNIQKAFDSKIQNALKNYFFGGTTQITTTGETDNSFLKMIELGIGYPRQLSTPGSYEVALCEPLIIEGLFTFYGKSLVEVDLHELINQPSAKIRGQEFESMVAYDIYAQLERIKTPSSLWQSYTLHRSKIKPAPIFTRSTHVSLSLVSFLQSVINNEKPSSTAIFQPSENASEPDFAIATKDLFGKIIVFIIQLKWQQSFDTKFFKTCFMELVFQSIMKKLGKDGASCECAVSDIYEAIDEERVIVRSVLVSVGCQVPKKYKKMYQHVSIYDQDNLSDIFSDQLITAIKAVQEKSRPVDIEFNYTNPSLNTAICSIDE